MKKMKRALSLMAAGVMALSTMGTTVHAETTLDNGNIWYGHELSVDVKEGENGYTFMSVYKGDPEYAAYYEASNHMVATNTGHAGPCLFVMIDTTKEYENNIWKPSGLYAYDQSNYEALYCCDVLTGAVDGTYYKRLNLEDSNYYDSEEAAHIRAIVTNSYPYVSVDEMKANLKAGGFEEADNLTRAEIITAVQAAIWSYANDEDGDYAYLKTYHVPDNPQWGKILHDYTGEMEVWWKKGKRVFTEGTEQNAIVGARINALRDYLKNLEPVVVEDKGIIISDIRVIASAPNAVEGKEDVYNAKLQIVLNNSGSNSEKDAIALDVYVDGDFKTSTPIEFGKEEYVINVEAKMGQTIKAVVSGTQDVPKGVYFYEPEGGRGVSQCMVGVAEGKTDIYAEASVVMSDNMQERILQFHKKAKLPEVVNGVSQDVEHSLKGIEFDIYYVCSVEEYNEQLRTDPTIAVKYEKPTKNLVNGKNPIATVKTDEGGRASYNLTEKNKPDGIYLIVEKEHDAIEKTLDPFLVTVPMTDDNSGYPVYNINLSLKNEVVRPTVEKDVTEIEQNEDNMNIGENVTWIIRGDIPKGMAKSTLYRLTDVLDYRLTYDGNVVVKVQAIDAEADNTITGDNFTLKVNEDYMLTVTKSEVEMDLDETVTEKEEITTLVVELTESGRKKVASSVGRNYDKHELRVYFNSHIDEDATMGTEIPNTVNLEYQNIDDYVWNVKPKTDPVVYTCGIDLYKHDSKKADFALKGAKFKLAKVVDAKTEGASQLVISKDENAYVVYENFYSSYSSDDKNELTGRINEVTTDENGKAMLYGLSEGTYYLVETKAPVLVDETTGEAVKYNLLSYPVKVTLNKESHLEDNRIEVANSNQFKLPSTGGIGTGIFTVSGSAMIALAGAVLVRNKKKETEE